MTKIIINGKFLSASMTGVHRVAMELTNALFDLVVEHHPSVQGLSFEVWLPKDGAKHAADVRLPTRVLPFLRSIPWEQLTLAWVSRNHLLLSLCNIGPVVRRNAMTMIHDVQVHLTPKSYSRPFRLWYHFVQPLLTRHNRHILTVSEFSKKEIDKIGLCDATKVTVILNGVDHVLHALADTSILMRNNLAPQRYVVALATTQTHKNIGLLLKAFADHRLADTNLVLFGGQTRDVFLAAGFHIPDNVHFTGRINDSELRGLLESALCLAFPSTTEGFGLPPLEAMLLGCPAIVAPCGALPEVCGPAVLYASPDNVAEWVAAIVSLRDDLVTRASLVVLGRARAREFTWRAAALSLAKRVRLEVGLAI